MRCPKTRMISIAKMLRDLAESLGPEKHGLGFEKLLQGVEMRIDEEKMKVALEMDGKTTDVFNSGEITGHLISQFNPKKIGVIEEPRPLLYYPGCKWILLKDLADPSRIVQLKNIYDGKKKLEDELMTAAIMHAVITQKPALPPPKPARQMAEESRSQE